MNGMGWAARPDASMEQQKEKPATRPSAIRGQGAYSLPCLAHIAYMYRHVQCSGFQICVVLSGTSCAKWSAGCIPRVAGLQVVHSQRASRIDSEWGRSCLRLPLWLVSATGHLALDLPSVKPHSLCKAAYVQLLRLRMSTSCCSLLPVAASEGQTINYGQGVVLLDPHAHLVLCKDHIGAAGCY